MTPGEMTTDPYDARREKLVRDRVPELIRAAGGSPDFRAADPAELHDLLLAKLYEEAGEFILDPSTEELADLLEVLRALAADIGCPWDELERVREAKAAARGAFTEGFALRGVGGVARPKVQKARALLLDGDELLLFRRAVPGRAPYYTTPGGRVEPEDRDVQAALHRELSEELGATTGRVRRVFTFLEQRPKADYVHNFFLCRLETMDLSLRHGPEFEDPARGVYDLERIPCKAEAFADLPLWPREVRDFLSDHAGDLPSLI